MPRVTKPTGGWSTPTPVWPDAPSEAGTTLYDPRPPMRTLIAMADADCLANYPVPFAVTPESLLHGLLTHPYVRLQRYADDGPPSDAVRRSFGPYATAVEGWVEVTASAFDESDAWDVAFVEGDTLSNPGIIGNRAQFAADDTASSAYKHLDVTEARARRKADAVAAQAAEAIGADIFVARRPYLRETKLPLGTTVCAPEEALAFLGLYLRTQGVFEVRRDPAGGSYRMNEGLYFWVGARELLPEAWRWMNACGRESSATGNQQLIFLAQSLVQRVQRALRARDDVHRALNRRQSKDTAEDVLSALDVVLFTLMGAVDVAARVAHVVLALQGSVRTAGWQNPAWITRVNAACAPLASVMGSTTNVSTVEVLRLLRNSVHGEALQPLGVERGTGNADTLIGLPVQDATVLLQAIDATGGRNIWGVQEVIPGRFHIDAGKFVETLFPRVLWLLNECMSKTPVETLAHVTLGPADLISPPTGPFQDWKRQSIRWQLGL